MKKINLKFHDCCISEFNRLLDRLFDHGYFRETEMKEFDARQGYVIFEIDLRERPDPSGDVYQDGIWWKIITDVELDDLKRHGRKLPYVCDRCKDDDERLRQGLLPLPRTTT